MWIKIFFVHIIIHVLCLFPIQPMPYIPIHKTKEWITSMKINARNSKIKINLLILYHLLDRVIFVLHWWWCHRSNMLWHIVSCRMFVKWMNVNEREKFGHVTYILFGNVAFISNCIDDIIMSWHVKWFWCEKKKGRKEKTAMRER